MQNIEILKPCHALEAVIRKCLCFQIKDCSAQIHDMLINEEPFGDKLICAFIQSYCVKFAFDYDEARD